MALNFPANPNIGDTYTVGSKIYVWNGVRWGSDYSNIKTGTTEQRPTVSKPYVYYNTSLRNYEVYLPEYSKWTSLYSYTVDPTIVDPTVEYSEASYTTPGSYQWQCPAGVAYVHVVCVGGGGGARSPLSSGYSGMTAGGTGGGLGWKNNIPVIPGNLYDVVVGAGGISLYGVTTVGSCNPGGNSYFIDTSTVAGFGGSGGVITSDRLGGSFVGDGGGNGGNCYTTLASGSYAYSGAGAGGYSGNGGNGFWHNGVSSIYATAGSGGGGGGGGKDTSFVYEAGCAGGGVGILGEGPSGAAGTSGGSGYPGGGGSGAVTSTVIGDLRGGSYGGGAGSYYGGNTNQHGGGGAVRIIWGNGRAFPSTNTGVI